jgi:pyruvate dehydrogenase E2 component (dihydrolipoyllysine-residue acetyltransferase)
VKDVIMPALGMAMTEGVLVRWIKQPGERVTAGDPIAEIETDKATVDLESPQDGVLGPHLVPPGAVVPIGGLLARVLTDDEARSGLSNESASTPSPDAKSRTQGAIGATTLGSTERGPRQPHRLSPRQRHLASSAPSGRAEVAQPSMGPSRRRQAIASQVLESWQTIPHFAVARELDVEQTVAEIDRIRQKFPAVSFTDLMLRSFALALAETLNLDSVDIGMAVATDGGVMTPIVAGPALLTVDKLIDARIEALARARSGRLNQHDLSGRPTGTLSNLGPYGVDWFTGIIPPGQACLLTVGKIAPRVVAQDGRPVVRMTLYATLNVDHRQLDGDSAARILNAFERHFAASGTLEAK